MELHKTQYKGCPPRLADYRFEGWKIYHYSLPPEMFMAVRNDYEVLRGVSQGEIEKLCLLENSKPTK
jgi:hypothetical protein